MTMTLLARSLSSPTAPRKTGLCVLLALAYGAGNGALAQESHLPLVQVEGPRDAAIGSADSASEGAVERASYQARPKLRPGDIVEAVPGVVATQHSGDGKANQYFLRGFNLDHGTDFAVTVDGMPVNMGTHAHGQGYSDLNFLIPEMVSGVRYRKGPYAVDNGDFSLAGSATLDYFSALDAPFAQITVGPNRYRRALLGGSTTQADQTWLAALELMGNDGPWTIPEDVRKLNAVLRYSQGSPTSGWHVTGMAYDSRWTATDQVPQRALQDGSLSRFGSLDPTTGGTSRRNSLSAKWFNTTDGQHTEISAYAIDQTLDLWSNFTYALANPQRGDQFEQTDRRRVLGTQATHRLSNEVASLPGLLSLGASWRGDRIRDLGLHLTQQRERYATVRQDKVSQDLFSLYGQQMVYFNDQWRGYAGLRMDALRFRVSGQEPVFGPLNSGKGSDQLLQPKFGLAYAPHRSHELYANAGTGFHSNDVRGATITSDPSTGAPAARVPALAKGFGSELGWRFAPDAGLQLTVALWQLQLDSELVYVGDAGNTEAGRASQRRGLEASLRWKPAPGWRVEVDGALSRARFRGAAEAGEGHFIDNAAERVVAAGVVWQSGPWEHQLRVRHMGARALNTTNTERSSPTTLLNVGTRYAVNRQLSLGLEVFNLVNRRINDIEYLYASCTVREVSSGVCNGGIEGRHLHPAEPRSLRLTLRAAF
ncbi:MAG: TonB-dependent receptor [Burkholderiaceae bacterium]|nr:TonB-dependent receptor [Burkholderiaceae bacterium]